MVRGRAPEGVERFPARALRVFRPVLVGLGIAADRRLLGDDGAAGGVQALAQRGEFVAAIDLEAQVVDTRRPAGIRDGEIDPRVFQHPFRVVVLEDGGLRREQLGIEANAGGEVGDVEMHVEAAHFDPFLLGLQVATGPHVPEPAQQFSVR